MHCHHAEIHDHDHGLQHDLETMVSAGWSRRQLLGVVGGAGVATGLLALAGCGSSGDSTVSTGTGGATSSVSNSASTATTHSSGCAEIPTETGGPYPGDGTNSNSSGQTVNVLTQSGVVRGDIRSSFGSFSGTAAGTPLTVTLTITDVTNSCSALVGYAVYIWHCDNQGRYSLYDVADQNYLRGVGETDSAGRVTFTTIFPACYAGRYPHIHFEVYPSLATATSAANRKKTSQLAMTAATCNAVYAQASLYPNSATRFASVSLSSDNVFNDGTALQTPDFTGDVNSGFVLTLDVGITP